MSTGSPASMPQLTPVSVTDWIPKLGEKAFLAWLQFHSWNVDSSSPTKYLPFSLNKIVKRLQIGKATFYEKVLNPLLKYGLIQLQPTKNARQEIHLIVYSYPADRPENATKSLQPVSTSEDFAPPENDQAQSNSPHPESTPSLESLPLEIQRTIQDEPLLQERTRGIIQAYKASCTHPSFDLIHFKKKMLSCVNYPHDKRRFGSYLLKALQNDWNKQGYFPPSPPPRTRPRDVPEWVWRQQESPQQPSEEDEISPEDKAEINELLRLLGEIP